MSNRFEFISENSTTADERHEQRSKALAHAARAAYRERMLRGQQFVPPQPPQRPSQPRLSLTSSRKPKPPKRGIRFAHNTKSSPKSEPPRIPTPPVPRNSLDHFTAASLPLTPLSQQICAFLISTWIPAHLIDPSHSPWLKFSVNDVIVHDAIRHLSESDTSAAESLPYLLMFQRLAGPGASQKWEMTALREKGKVIAMVRRSVEDLEKGAAAGGELSKPGGSDGLIALIMQLFVAAVCGNHFEEARLHGVTLQRLLFRKITLEGERSVMPGIISYTVQHDAQLSQMTMQRTVFDLEFWASWIERNIAAVDPVESYLRPRHEDFEANLDPCLRQGEVLRKVCRDMRICQWLWRLEGPFSDKVNGLRIAYYLLWWHTFNLGRLSNHHLDVRDRLTMENADQKPVAMADDYVQVILAVSLLLYSATFAGNPTVGGVDLWPKVDLLWQHLKSYLEDFDLALARLKDLTPLSDKWHRPMLYGYWIGATWEQRWAADPSKTASTWFIEGFVDLARTMGLKGWNDVKEVVDTFSDHDFVNPSGDVWVDHVVRKGLG